MKEGRERKETQSYYVLTISHTVAPGIELSTCHKFSCITFTCLIPTVTLSSGHW
jgi:hypothetical protein